MAGFLAGLFPLAGKLLSGGSLLKSAYGGGGAGLMNLGMDLIPLVTDIANNDVGLKSFSGFGGTLAGTKFGGRELNKLGEEKLNSGVLQRARDYDRNKIADRYEEVNRSRVARGKDPLAIPSVEDSAKRYRESMTPKLLSDPTTSKQGYNMPIGMGADIGLYSLTSGMGKPKESPEIEALMKQQEMSNSPVSRYMQMTGVL